MGKFPCGAKCMYVYVFCVAASASANECRRTSQQLDTEFYSKPLKGQNVSL